MGIFSKTQTIEEKKRRFLVLAHLSDLNVMEVADTMLAEACTAQGIPTSMQEIQASMTWLADGRFIVLKERGPILVAALVHAGQEVVRGITTPEGFERPVDFVRRS